MLLSSAGAAFASGGIWLLAPMTTAVTIRGRVRRHARHGRPDLQLSRRSRNRDKAVADDLRKIGLRGSHLAQYWLDGKELRLLLYREREAAKTHGYVELTILTKATRRRCVYDGTLQARRLDDCRGRRQAKASQVEHSTGKDVLRCAE